MVFFFIFIFLLVCPVIWGLLVAKPALWDRKACRNAPCMFGHPICLDTPNICLDDPLYVLMMFGCPVHTQHKKACFVRLRGVHMSPYIWMPRMFGCTYCMFWCPHMFGHQPHFGCPFYVWKSPTHLDVPLHVWTPPFVWMAQYFWMHPLYVWMPPYVWMPTYMFGFCHMFGCPHPCLWTQYVWMAPYVWITPCMFGCP